MNAFRRMACIGSCTHSIFFLSTLTARHRSFWDVLDKKDRMRVYAAFSELILHRSGVARLRCRIQTSFEDYFLPMDATFSYGTFGIACSLWVPFSEGSH